MLGPSGPLVSQASSSGYVTSGKFLTSVLLSLIYQMGVIKVFAIFTEWLEGYERIIHENRCCCLRNS